MASAMDELAVGVYPLFFPPVVEEEWWFEDELRHRGCCIGGLKRVASALLGCGVHQMAWIDGTLCGMHFGAFLSSFRKGRKLVFLWRGGFWWEDLPFPPLFEGPSGRAMKIGAIETFFAGGNFFFFFFRPKGFYSFEIPFPFHRQGVTTASLWFFPFFVFFFPGSARGRWEIRKLQEDSGPAGWVHPLFFFLFFYEAFRKSGWRLCWGNRAPAFFFPFLFFFLPVGGRHNVELKGGGRRQGEEITS